MDFQSPEYVMHTVANIMFNLESDQMNTFYRRSLSNMSNFWNKLDREKITNLISDLN